MTTNRSGSYARVVDPKAGGATTSSVLARADAEYAGVTSLERLEIELLLEGVFRHYGYDFRSYAFSSLRRRLRKRLQAENLPTFSALQDRLLHDPEAMERLLRDMSVNVTGMFRDPTFFLALRQTVVPISTSARASTRRHREGVDLLARRAAGRPDLRLVERVRSCAGTSSSRSTTWPRTRRSASSTRFSVATSSSTSIAI